MLQVCALSWQRSWTKCRLLQFISSDTSGSLINIIYYNNRWPSEGLIQVPRYLDWVGTRSAVILRKCSIHSIFAVKSQYKAHSIPIIRVLCMVLKGTVACNASSSCSTFYGYWNATKLVILLMMLNYWFVFLFITRYVSSVVLRFLFRSYLLQKLTGTMCSPTLFMYIET